MGIMSDELSEVLLMEPGELNETCAWGCGEPITDDTGLNWCSRRASYMHPGCHYESECRCPE